MALAEAETAITALCGGARRCAARLGVGRLMNGIAGTVDVTTGFDQVIVDCG